MSSLLSIVPRASTTATVVLSAICLMSGVLPQHPCAYAQDDPTPEVTEAPDPTDVSLPETPVPTVPLPVGMYRVSRMTAEKATVVGNFGWVEEDPEKKKEVKETLESDFEKNLEEGESRRRQEEEAKTTGWKVLVSNLKSINNTGLEFDVEATKTELANGDEEAAAAPKALEDFNGTLKVGGNAAFAGLEELYTKETGTAPRDGFSISSVTVSQTVETEVFAVTEAPEEVVMARGSSVSIQTWIIILSSVLGGVCLSALCALAVGAMIKRRSQGQGQTVQSASSETEPYGEKNEQKEALNPLEQGENDLPFSPAEGTKGAAASSQPEITHT